MQSRQLKSKCVNRKQETKVVITAIRRRLEIRGCGTGQSQVEGSKAIEIAGAPGPSGFRCIGSLG